VAERGVARCDDQDEEEEQERADDLGLERVPDVPPGDFCGEGGVLDVVEGPG
jgi:hypothetical protein